MRLTSVSHSKAYGDGRCLCEGFLETPGVAFVHCSGRFGNVPYHLGIEQARAMSVVLAALVAEHDGREAALSAEYGPMS